MRTLPKEFAVTRCVPATFNHRCSTTSLATQSDPDTARRDFEALYPTKRILTPGQVANAAVFLASDEAVGVNGTSLVVDDGLLAKTY